MPRREVRAALKIGDSERIILFVGRVEPAKGAHILVDAFARLAADPDLRLVFVGGGQESFRSVIDERGLSERIHLAGPANPDTVALWMKPRTCSACRASPKAAQRRPGSDCRGVPRGGKQRRRRSRDSLGRERNPGRRSRAGNPGARLAHRPRPELGQGNDLAPLDAHVERRRGRDLCAVRRGHGASAVVAAQDTRRNHPQGSCIL